jgi:hypothetical protein
VLESQPLQGVNVKWHRHIRIWGFVREVDHDNVSVEFPTGDFPIKARDTWVDISSGFGDL